MIPAVVDFETKAIRGNTTTHPPEPVGVAHGLLGKAPQYMAWGHPSENTHTRSEAAAALRRYVVEEQRPIIFFNAAFDYNVWREHLPDVPLPRQVDDAMWMVFLQDPYSQGRHLHLKGAAEHLLGIKPDEQTELKKWILAHVPGATARDWGAYISEAPGDMVAPYARGDVFRTGRIWEYLEEKLRESGMWPAYERERALFPIINEATLRGVRCNAEKLKADEIEYTTQLMIAEEMLAARLGISTADLHNDESFADALENKGFVRQWVYTEKNKARSLAKKNLKIEDPVTQQLIAYRSSLATCLQNFYRVWISCLDGNRLHPTWNQVRTPTEKGKLSKGARTGRLSSDTPNLMAIPNEFTLPNGDPLPVPEGLRELPRMREYLLPDPGFVWLKRDFSSQEVRILAHFEDGPLQEAYVANPDLDPHQMIRQRVLDITGMDYARKQIKISVFSIIYGSGATSLAEQLGVSKEYATQIRNSLFLAMPGLNDIMSDVMGMGRAKMPIRTWGGRLYLTEPPKVIKGRRMSFEYKLLNYLIQGSAADQTKDVIVEWDGLSHSLPSELLCTVHDEINIQAPVECWEDQMKVLKDCMEGPRFSVPMRSEGFYSERSWADLRECP